MSRNKRATQRQLEVMVNFINKHRELIDGKLSLSFTPQKRDKLWEELTCLLNADICGPVKSSNKWRRSWIDLKCEAKARAAIMYKQQNQAGKGVNLKPLPPLLKKINNMISEVSEEGNSEITTPVSLEYIKRENLVEETIETDGCRTDETTENSFQNKSIPGPSKNEVKTDTALIPCRSLGRWSRISKKTRDRASQRQLETLVDFVNSHREMINRKFSTSFTAQKRAKLWEELTCLLNSDELGPVKSSLKWRRTWIDLKCDAKARAAAIHKFNQTGEGSNVRPLTPLFEKIINIISQELEEGKSQISEAARLEYNIKGNSAEETTENDSNRIGEIVENLFQNESVDDPSISENITDSDSTPSLHLKSRHRLVSAESLTNFLEIEKEKVAALNALAKEKMIANNLRERLLKIEEERNALYSRRTELFVNIANAFLEKF